MKTFQNIAALLAFVAFISVTSLPGQVQTSASGTGKSTGEIARILVSNLDSVPVRLAAQTVYIPSDGDHQGYFGRIPGGLIIDAGGQASISVSGYCIHPNRPPAPSGYELPPLSEWVPVAGNPSISDNPFSSEKNVFVVTVPPVDRFSEDDIAELESASIYKRHREVPSGIQPTWPGTVGPVGGTINVDKTPEVVAPLIVAMVEAVENATDDAIRNGEVDTPYSGYSDKQRETLIQHTIWIYMSLLTGEQYSRDDFRNNIYRQLGGAAALPKEEKDSLETGVAEFWNAFEATGVKAKVLVRSAAN